MPNLNLMLKTIVPTYVLPNSSNEAFGRAATLAVITGASYFMSSDETGVPLLDDYIFPAITSTLAGLTCLTATLAADFFLHNHAE